MTPATWLQLRHKTQPQPGRSQACFPPTPLSKPETGEAEAAGAPAEPPTPGPACTLTRGEMGAQRLHWACPGPHSRIHTGLLTPALFPLHRLQVLPQKCCLHLLEVREWSMREKNSRQAAETHVHPGSPMALPLPLPLPSVSSPLSPADNLWQHLPRRTLHFHWQFHVGADRPPGVRGSVGPKHGDRRGAGSAGARDSPCHCYRLSPPALTSEHTQVSVALRNWEPGWRDMTC